MRLNRKNIYFTMEQPDGSPWGTHYALAFFEGKWIAFNGGNISFKDAESNMTDLASPGLAVFLPRAKFDTAAKAKHL